MVRQALGEESIAVHRKSYLIETEKKSIPHSAVTSYGDCMNMCEDFAPNFDKRTGCCVTTTLNLTLLFSPPIFFWAKSNITVIPYPLYFSVSPIKDKTERPPFGYN
jgi:hypothetical protein